jgi:hypothetical protein
VIVRFATRAEAGRRLAEALAAYAGRSPLVLAIPRGAVEIGAIVAQRLGGELDVVLVRKLCAPKQPELALGAVDESGWTWIAPYVSDVGADAAWIEREKVAELELLRARRARYTPGRPPLDARGRIAIVVDDGIATGASMIAALHAVRGKRPARLVCAVPVASPEGLERVAPYADEVVCLDAPQAFRAVGQHYREFRQVEDDEVMALLGSGARTSSRRRRQAQIDER